MVQKKTVLEEKNSGVVYDVQVKDPKPIADKPNCYRFTLIVNGVTIYGMKDIAYKDKDSGEDRSFVAFPGYKGNNEQFYNNCWFPISRELQEKIEEQIANLLP